MEDEMQKILIIGKDATIRRVLAEELAGEGYVVVTTGNPALTGGLLYTLTPDLVFLDFRLRGHQCSELDEIGRQAPHISVLPFTSCLGSEEEGVSLDMIRQYAVVLRQKAVRLLRKKSMNRLLGEELIPPQEYDIRQEGLAGSAYPKGVGGQDVKKSLMKQSRYQCQCLEGSEVMRG